MFRFSFPLLLLVVFTSCLEVSGQAARTPFSAFGYGDTYTDALIHNQGMGGAGVSNPQYWYLNNMNPALLTYNRFTVFQAGTVLDKNRIYSDTLRENSTGGNLNYLTIGFPLMRSKRTGETRWGTSLGLIPYSYVDYLYSYTKEIIGGDGESIPVHYFEQAKGGINEVYWSNGVRLSKYINIGLKTSFLFSSISTDFTNLLDHPDQAAKYSVNVHELQSIKGVRFIPGLHLHKDSINRKYTLNIGATYELSSKINTNFEQVLQRQDAGGSILQSDTLNISIGNSNLPNKMTIGASFGRFDKWMFATDFSLLKPSANKFTLGLDETDVTDGWRFASGFELTPDSRSLGSYLKRITYRTGISAESGTYLVNGNAVKDFGINFGLSFPVNRISSLDLAFRTGKRGDMKLNGIEENYFKIYFGVTFNDQWFIKRRFD
jgi:hypothetical protein